MLRELAIEKNGALTKNIELVDLGRVANDYASKAAFSDYKLRKAKNTLRRQKADLALFAAFIETTGAEIGDLFNDHEAWRGVSWGLVAAFQRWMLGRGYAVSSVNVRVSTIKTYARLALRAGVLDAAGYTLIKGVEGYSHKEGKRIDERRKAQDIVTRKKGAKKADPVSLATNQAEALKDRPDTSQGRRDALLMCLLIDHGLRVGEVAGLQVGDFDIDAGELRFYREKVDMTQTHKLSGDTWRAARSYFTLDMIRKHGPALMGSVKGGELTGIMSTRAITARAAVLGAEVGAEGLSPHDCRHYAATRAAREPIKKNIHELMEIFGWKSTAMAVRYIEAAHVIEVE